MHIHIISYLFTVINVIMNVNKVINPNNKFNTPNTIRGANGSVEKKAI